MNVDTPHLLSVDTPHLLSVDTPHLLSVDKKRKMLVEKFRCYAESIENNTIVDSVIELLYDEWIDESKESNESNEIRLSRKRQKMMFEYLVLGWYCSTTLKALESSSTES